MKKIISVVLLIIAFNITALAQSKNQNLSFDIHGKILNGNVVYSTLIHSNGEDEKSRYNGVYYIVKGVKENHLLIIADNEHVLSIYVGSRALTYKTMNIHNSVDEKGYPYRVGITPDGYLSIMDSTTGDIYTFFKY